MAVKFTKPEINVREKLAELDKPSGIAGEAMLRAETVEEQQALIGVGRRNLLINGGFDVWQRGTSFTIGNNSVTYAPDRWAVYSNSASARSVVKVEDVIDGHTINALKWTVTSPTIDSQREVRQLIEGLKQFSNQTLTLSYYAKSSVNATYEVETRESYGSGGSTTVDTIRASHNITTTWQKFETTFNISDLTSETFGDGSYLSIMFVRRTLVTNDLYLANIQLEFGKVATPFEYRSYGEELALCQRYYHTLRSGIFGVATAVSTIAFTYSSPVTMRVTPTIGFKDSNDDIRVGDMVAQGHTINTCSIGTTTYSSVESQSWSISGTPSAPQSGNLTPYRTYLLEPQYSNHGTFTFSSEL
jgi:hypothetical protein